MTESFIKVGREIANGDEMTSMSLEELERALSGATRLCVGIELRGDEVRLLGEAAPLVWGVRV